MKYKLTLKEAIETARSGDWEFAFDIVPSGSDHNHEWMQKGRIGHGGEAHSLRSGTIFRMEKLGLIRFAMEKWPHRIYRWTAKGGGR